MFEYTEIWAPLGFAVVSVWSGVALSSLIGIRDWRLLAGTGIFASSFLKAFGLLLTWLFGEEPTMGSRFFVAMSIGITTLALVRISRALLNALFLTTILAVCANLLMHQELVGWLPHADSIDMLYSAEVLIPAGNLPATMKRGLLLPIWMSSTDAGPPWFWVVTYVGLFFFVYLYWVADYCRKQGLTSARASTISFISIVLTPIVFMLPFYAQNHAIVGIGVSLMVLVAMRQDRTPCNHESLAALSVASIMISLSRAEGFLLSTAILAYLIHFNLLQVEKKYQSGFLIAGPMAFACWALLIDSDELPTQAGLVLGLVGIFSLVILLTSHLFPIMSINIFGLIVPSLFAGSLVWQFLSGYRFQDFVAQVVYQFANLFMVRGGWGFLPLMVLAAAILFVEDRRPPESLEALYVLLAISSLNFGLKFLDGRNLGRFGITDSINRGWIHFLPILLVFIALGLDRLFRVKRKRE